MPKKEIKLNLACGNDYREGYVNIDDQSMNDGQVDFVKNVFELNWKDNDVDEILVSHFMMYVDTIQAPPLIKDWYTWLKKDGILIIETGDLKKIAKTVLNTDNPNIINGTNGVMQLFGWANTKGHKWAWCADTLVPLLKETGFKIDAIYDGGLHNRPERDLTIIAKK